MFNVQASYTVQGRTRPVWLDCLPALAVWAASTAYVAAKLPATPVRIGDSVDYIEIAANRPPAYGWMLYILKGAGLVGPDYAGLPLVQTALISRPGCSPSPCSSPGCCALRGCASPPSSSGCT